jgi:hypothetical protein
VELQLDELCTRGKGGPTETWLYSGPRDHEPCLDCLARRGADETLDQPVSPGRTGRRRPGEGARSGHYRPLYLL